MKNLIQKIKQNKIEIILLIILAIFSFSLRFIDLGFHHFYGDEIKTLFLRKDESAFDFFMEQRKGPIQFLIVWVTEKITGGFNEFSIRLPFAIFGFVLVFVFYYFVRVTLKYNFNVSIFSTFLVSLNGIYIAFSRTAQYQMVYLVFGFLTLIFFKKYLDEKVKKKSIMYFLLATFFFTLGLLTHYDVLFFLLPLFLIFKEYKKSILMFILSCSVAFVFYGPQIYLGFFSENTAGYLSKRIVGKEYLPNYTPYTFLLYNPLFIYLLLILFLSIYGYYKSLPNERAAYGRWFFWPFILLDFFVLIPGTHVHNYLFPLFILSGIGFDNLQKIISYPVSIVSLIFVYLVQLQVFLPKLNLGYPFRDSTLFGLNQLKINKGYSTPIYGFVYNRSWKEIGEFMRKQKRVPSFTTNENKVVAEYYLFGYSYTDWDPIKPAEFFILINNSQEIEKIVPVDLLRYEKISEGTDYQIFKLIR
jgi:hypothetical protein